MFQRCRSSNTSPPYLWIFSCEVGDGASGKNVVGKLAVIIPTWPPSGIKPETRLLFRSGFIPAQITLEGEQGGPTRGFETNSRARCGTKALFHVRIAVCWNLWMSYQPAPIQTLADGAEYKAVPWHRHRSPSKTLGRKKERTKKKNKKKNRARPGAGLAWQYNRGKNYRGLFQLAWYGLALRYYTVRGVK